MYLLLVVALFGLIFGTSYFHSEKAEESNATEIVAIVPAGDDLVMACHGDKSLKVIDRKSGELKRSISLSHAPYGVCTDGDLAYVSVGGASGMIEVVNWKTGELIRKIPAGHTPMSPVKRGNSLFVANRFNNEVAEYDVTTGQKIRAWQTPREPVAVVASADGKTVWAINHLPDGVSNGDYTAAAITRIQGDEVTNVHLLNGTQSMRGLAMSPDGKFLAATHILSRYQVPTTQLDRGWMNTNAVTIIDTSNPKKYYTVLLDDADRGAANPWAVEFSGDGSKLVVAHAGLHELSVIDFPRLMGKIEAEKSPERISEKLSYLEDIRVRIPLSLNGPRSLAVVGQDIFAAGYFSDSVSKLALEGKTEAMSWDYSKKKPPTVQRLGERYFNDASLCFQGWQSCESCHPDSRVDGLNWDLLNDGMGNPKNTRTMFLSHRTCPVMSLGVRKSAEVAVNSGFKYIQFVDPGEDVLACVNEYLKEMKEVPSPCLVSSNPEKSKTKDASCAQCHAPGVERGSLSESAQRGKMLFKEAGCVSCHAHPWFTSKQLYDVGTTEGLDEGRKVIVPSLIEVWRTGPYLHDGRAKTIKEAITIHNKGDKRGRTSHLSPRQIDDLAEYVRSL